MKARSGQVLPAVDEHGAHVGHLGGRGPADEGEDGEGVLGDAHVWPLRVMVLEHRALVLAACLGVPFTPLDGGKKRMEEMVGRLGGGETVVTGLREETKNTQLALT